MFFYVSILFYSFFEFQYLCRLNEHAIIITNLRDYLYHASTLCACDAQLFVEGFTEQEKQGVEKARIKEGSGDIRVWYPLTQTLLARMVFSVSLSFVHSNELTFCFNSRLEIFLSRGVGQKILIYNAKNYRKVCQRKKGLKIFLELRGLSIRLTVERCTA